jgi:hypothetical protein
MAVDDPMIADHARWSAAELGLDTAAADPRGVPDR